MSLLPQILAKRAGQALDTPAIERFVAGVSRGSAPDYQISALLMAIFFQGMDREETVALTRAMAESGETYDWADLDKPTADKHSTGGVGDKLSLVVAPLAAAMGMAVPMLSGRGLGFTGGTLDKLEAIPGFLTQLTRGEFEDQLSRLGCAFVGQSRDLAPADRKLYSLRDVTGTIESLPLIVSSILSKKIAAGPESLVIDLKVGRGAFMPDLERARSLGEALRETALAFGRRCAVLFTAMDAPLGRTVGNGPEVAEALDTLAGRGPLPIQDLSLDLVAEMARLAGIAESAAAARVEARRALDAGRALERFLAVAKSQGGRLIPEAEGWGLPEAPAHRDVFAPADGFLLPPDARAVGRLCVQLGAGRAVAEDGVDSCAGLRFFQDWGDPVSRGERIARVEGSDPQRVERAAADLTDLLTVGDAGKGRASLRLAILDGEGYRLES